MKVETRPDTSAPAREPARCFSTVLAQTKRAAQARVPAAAKPKNPELSAPRRATGPATRQPNNLPSKPKPMSPPVSPPRKPGNRTESAATVQRARVAARARASTEHQDKVLSKGREQSEEASRERVTARRESDLRTELLRAVIVEERSPARPPGDNAHSPLSAQNRVEASADRASPTAETSSASTAQSFSDARAEAIAALVERISVAIKGGQPGLELELGTTLAGGRVSITRTATNEVAIQIRGCPRAAASELRSALSARGLRVRSLEIA